MPKRRGPDGLRLLRIRSDDLQIAGRAECHEGVASAKSRMLPPGRGLHPKLLLDRVDAELQIGCGVNEMVDAPKQVAG